MKLRIKGDSLRLRIGPSELERLTGVGQIEETVHFGLDDNARLTYALEIGGDAELAVRHEGTRIVVILPRGSARIWARGNDVGVYGSVAVSGGSLEVAVEKDWACLDRSDAEDADTFPNPKDGASC
jgi:hypothetical protein